MSSSLPKVLADGTTRAKGIHHVRLSYYPDFTEVVDSVKILRHWYDPAGQIVATENGANERMELTLDAVGNTIAKTYSDGTSEWFEYDGNDLPIAAGNEAAEIRLARDGLGNIVREELTYDGKTYVSESAYDPAGVRIRRSSSYGLDESITRDAIGVRTRSEIGRKLVTHQYDIMGNETRRGLPSAANIESDYDAMGWLLRRRLTSAAAPPARAVIAEPAWMGRRRPGTSVEVAYRWSDDGRVLEEFDSGRGTTSYEYDPRGRILASIPPNLRKELFRYDETSNSYQAAKGQSATRYAPGNVLIERDGWEYQWDNAGRLAAKRRRSSDNDVAEYQYKWDARNLLREVVLPDGRLLEFDYDPYDRRTTKRVRSAAEPGEPRELLEKTSFVWDGEALAHEIRSRAAENGDAIIEERTYFYVDRTLEPWAHQERRTTTAGDVLDDRLLFYMNDPLGTPQRLIDERGAVAAELELTLFRAAVSGGDATPLRSQGQYADDETGLAYNRHRYYDPEAGRFLSPDPLELAGGLNTYLAGANPITWIDPFGLAKKTHYAKADVNGDPLNNGQSYNSKQEGPEYKSLCDKNNTSSMDPKKKKSSYERRLCHTEQKACEAARGKKPPLKPGDTVTITGKRKPCTGCKGAMNALKRDTGADVVYRYGPGGKYTWTAKG